LRSSGLVLFAVIANYLFSKYRRQALIFKILYRLLTGLCYISCKISDRPVKFRPYGNPSSNVFTMFAGFCGHADKNHIYTVLTVTTGPLRAKIMLIMSSVKMSLTRMIEGRD